MNELERYCTNSNLDPIEAMNRLQNEGIVSDNAVYLSDVALEDQQRAIEFLKLQRKT